MRLLPRLTMTRASDGAVTAKEAMTRPAPDTAVNVTVGGQEATGSLAGAVQKAEAGSTITLGRNITFTNGFEVEGTVTLDLAGYAINGIYENWADGSEDHLLAVKRLGGGVVITADITCDVKLTRKGEAPTGDIVELTIRGSTI